MSASSCAPPATRDINPSAPSPSNAKTDHKPTFLTEKEKPKSMDYHRQVLQSRLEEDSTKQNYISPSDTIMSPCTAKLSAYKSKHFMKAKPQQSLFAKMEASRKVGNTEGQEKIEKN